MKTALLTLVPPNPAPGLDEAALREAIKADVEAGKATQAAIAREADVSPSALSQWLGGKYKGDAAQVAAKLAIWRDARGQRTDVRRKAIQAVEWVETQTARNQLSVLEFAQNFGKMAAVFGDAGLGKTTTIKRYRKLKPNVWVLTADPSTANWSPLLRALAREIGIPDTGTADRLKLAIERRLRDTKGLIIVDEAQHLTIPALEVLRGIHDALGIGLVLAGNLVVCARFGHGDQAIGQEARFAQLTSRLGRTIHVQRPEEADIHAIGEAYGITGTEELELLFNISRYEDGALRAVMNVLRIASIATFDSGEPITCHILRAAAYNLDLGRFDGARAVAHG